jgi:3-hydroxyacyl-CoA dehydrogenase
MNSKLSRAYVHGSGTIGRQIAVAAAISGMVPANVSAVIQRSELR